LRQRRGIRRAGGGCIQASLTRRIPYHAPFPGLERPVKLNGTLRGPTLACSYASGDSALPLPSAGAAQNADYPKTEFLAKGFVLDIPPKNVGI